MNVLIVIDNTESSATALEEVAALPWPERAAFDVFTVMEQSGVFATEEAVTSALEVAKETLDNAVVLLRDAGLHAKGTISSGDEKDMLQARIEATRPDLIVTGSHDLARYALRHDPYSVALVRPRLDREILSRRILLATDGSEFSAGAARAIAQRPWPLRSEVRIISVVEPVLPTMHALFDPPFVQTDEVQLLREQAVARAQDAVTAAEAILASTGLEVNGTVSILLDGTTEVILKEAREWGADWIFAGSHGVRSLAERLLMGSVPEALAKDAPCSVEIVRSTRISPAQ